MAANGSGWSCNYLCILETDPDVSKLSPTAIPRKTGLVLSVQQLHFVRRSHLSEISYLKEKDVIQIFHCPDSKFSTIEDARKSLSELLRDLGIPTTDVNSLADVLFSHFCRRRSRQICSGTELVCMGLDLVITTVLRNDDEYQDWLYGGAMDSVVVKTLRATQQAIDGLKKTKYWHCGECGEAAECVVCLEELRDGEKVTWLPCSHIYHGGCIGEWLTTNHRCPVCRFPVPWVYVLEDKALQQVWLPLQ